MVEEGRRAQPQQSDALDSRTKSNNHMAFLPPRWA